MMGGVRERRREEGGRDGRSEGAEEGGSDAVVRYQMTTE